MAQKDLMQKVERESNIELLRIVLMMMVIMHHLIVHGCSLSNIQTGSYQQTNKDALYLFLNTFSVIGVNCFIFISGFYGIKFKLKTLITFIAQAIFYSASIYLIHNYFTNSSISYIELKRSFFPITYVRWWFFNVYIALFILSPIINKGLEHINKKQTITVIILLFIIGGGYPLVGYNFFTQDGYSFFNLLTVYIIAYSCNKYIPKIKNVTPIYLLFLITSFIIIYLCFIHNRQLLTWRLMSYNCILILILAISFFYIFKQFSFKNSLINKIAPLTFGIYLIHDSSVIRNIISSFIKDMNNKNESSIIMLLILLGTTAIIFVTCGFIEKIRQILFNPVISYLYDKTKMGYNKVKKHSTL